MDSELGAMYQYAAFVDLRLTKKLQLTLHVICR